MEAQEHVVERAQLNLTRREFTEYFTLLEPHPHLNRVESSRTISLAPLSRHTGMLRPSAPVFPTSDLQRFIS
jgi:hypothetical protein